MNKKAFFQHLSNSLSEKIARLQLDIADLQKDIAEDSKSSAGDKFETSREMAQQELGKLSTQLNEQQRIKSLIENQPLDKPVQAQLGTLIETNKGLFLLGIPIGTSSFEGKNIVGIGLGAPLGQLMLHKKKADHISFNNQDFIIEEIY
ncbi:MULTISPECIES: hypothetical protein [Fluviicola]|uniref:hypothetical protein n=1 Tax=Fluviicola TaxID=332102 RepID=UPI003137CFE7